MSEETFFKPLPGRKKKNLDLVPFENWASLKEWNYTTVAALVSTSIVYFNHTASSE